MTALTIIIWNLSMWVILKLQDSKDLFNAIQNFQIKFSDAKNKQNEFLNKLNNIKTGKNYQSKRND